MKLLLVEDDETLISQLETELRRIATRLQLVVARSRDSAFECLTDDWFDVVVTDLRLPTCDYHMDSEVEHGQAVWAKSQELSPGTPIIVLSAYLDLGLMKRVLDRAEREDIFGSGERFLLLNTFEKKALPTFLRYIESLDAQIRVLDDIEIQGDAALSQGQRRVLQIFARTHGGSQAMLQAIGGGLSEASTFRIEVEDARGVVTARALAKVAAISLIEDEHSRCGRVTSVLRVGSCVSDLRVLRAGAGPLGGVFYPFAETHSSTLFGVLESDQGRALQALCALREIEADWQANAWSDETTVQSVRRNSISNEALEKIASLIEVMEWEEFEKRRVPVRQCCQHGDLHGGNILVSTDGAPLLIDYGDVGEATSALDPVTLELSMVFHPDAQKLRQGWPSLEAAEQWSDIDSFVAGCPFPDLVKACRSWAEACGRGGREVAATAYGVAIRQLKYDAALHPLANAIARSAIRAFG